MIAHIGGLRDREVPTIGVEEEFVLVDRVSGHPVGRNRDVAEAAARRGLELDLELTSCQVEIATPTLTSIDDVGGHLRRLRGLLSASADDVAIDLIAAGVPPTVPDSFPITDGDRYRRIAERFGMLAHEQGISGCHVHVGVPDQTTALGVCNWLRPWLPILLALSANSAIHRDADTGYASWRSVLWSRWPAGGPPPYLRSVEHLAEIRRTLVDTGAVLDEHMIYWDVRPSDHLPTIEIRVGDVQGRAAETQTLASLARAAVMTATAELRADRVPDDVDPTVLSAAYWRAAHDGLSGSAVDVVTGRLVEAQDHLHTFVDRVSHALDHLGELLEVERSLHRSGSEGNGAIRQRAVFDAEGSGRAVAAAARVDVADDG
ncbi:carboxylate-amine ligase [Gordonia soli]|uniref:Putative glutamate--cysteine ligase 2 n=1 Tax=Gordonia soli NBRC 108243 TaxID=1223545 RepID=M0QMH8_9ACTN|nr:glutamate--cysteine ligase [Gordonia soli]GAC69629.1 carboxylate-amine ligase [Gordonia soli NBRC 108243]